MSSEQDRAIAMEERVSWLQKLTDDLSTQMAVQDRRIMHLEQMCARLNEGMRNLAQERAAPPVGAMPEDDPVPRSG